MDSYYKQAMSAPTLLEQADLCVKCGLCLPHCPTYQQSQHEADSPRGRIALIQGLATGQLSASGPLNRHLDGCLSCRSCETACPAQVPYGRLLDEGRALQIQQRPAHARRVRWGAAWLTQPGLRTVWSAPVWLLQKTGLLSLLQKLPLPPRWQRLLQRLPLLRWPVSPRQAVAADAPAVQLFTGCTGAWMDGKTLDDAVLVLNRIGYRVLIPASQQCCGALHQHAGLAPEAERLAAANRQAFRPDIPILSIASGCGSSLKDYRHFSNRSIVGSISAQVQDLSHFLVQHWPAALPVRALRKRVAVHQPCTLRNGLQTASSVKALLQKIPQLDIAEMPKSAPCCGAAGSHMITHGDAADALGESTARALLKLDADEVVSSNIGCALHLAAELRQQGFMRPVRHPVSLLAAELRGG